MKRTLMTSMVIILPYFMMAQDLSCDAKICARHRTDPESEVCMESATGQWTMNYLKSGLIESARQYSVELPKDCILAKIKIIAQKDGVETDSREYTFSKTEMATSFSFDNNGRMGPYMKNKGEDTVVIELTVYKKNPDGTGFTKIPKSSTTYTIYLDQEVKLMAENE